MTRYLPFYILAAAVFGLLSCDLEDKSPELELAFTVDAPLSLIDNVIHVPVLQDSAIDVHYSVFAPGRIEGLNISLDGMEEGIQEAKGSTQFNGSIHMDVPFDNVTREVILEVMDGSSQVRTSRIQIAVEAAGSFSVDGEIEVSGNVRQGHEVTISGSGFGEGPTLVLFDDFEGGDPWDPIPLEDALIGAWSAKSEGSYTPRYHEYAYGGNTSFSMEDEVAEKAIWGKKQAQLKARFEDTQEVFISYHLAVPPERNYPGADSRGQWGSGSHWKMSWLMDGDDGFGSGDGKADLCIPTNGQAQAMQIGGNTDNIGWVGSLDNLFDIDGFNRVTTWLKADSANVQDAGYTWIQWLSAKTSPIFENEYEGPVFNARTTSPTSYQWNQFNVPGWYGNNLTNPGGVYDNVYLATGEHSPARVEIGDSATYEDCTQLTIMPALSWTDSEIQVIVKTKGEETISGKYLFIFSGQNQLLFEGIPIP